MRLCRALVLSENSIGYKNKMQKEIKNYTREKLKEIITSYKMKHICKQAFVKKDDYLNELNKQIKPYLTEQILNWVYIKQVENFDDMTNISKSERELLKKNFVIKELEIEEIKTSKDGSKKYSFKLSDGNLIESVLIPSEKRGTFTLCISSQVGCKMGCKFCLTGKMGFIRNLETFEIISQITTIQKKDRINIKNVVFMGMGEPFDNYENVQDALCIIIDILKFSKRKVTVSTSGLTNRFENFGKFAKANLAVSINASNNATRNSIMPINRKFPIEKIISACKDYTLKPRDKITFEYVLIEGINDSKKDAEELLNLLKGIKAKVNLIPFNESDKTNFKKPSKEKITAFQKILLKKRVTTIVRKSLGSDISAACGQLIK